MISILIDLVIMKTFLQFSKLNKDQTGFALLMTLIVVTVVVSIGLSILGLSIKQAQLSSNAKESEVAFHAANAGSECARLIRKRDAAALELGQDINPSCFGVNSSPTSVSPTTPAKIGDGDVYLYHYKFTWGTADVRCTDIYMLIASSSPIGAGVTTTNMSSVVPGYPNGTDSYCEPGSRCTVLSVQGYNKGCDYITSPGVVQRDVLLEY